MTSRSNAFQRQTHSLVLGTTLMSTETLNPSRCFLQSLADNTLIGTFLDTTLLEDATPLAS